MPEFQDWEPEDSYAPEGEPDPLQVARRIHEDRVAVAFVAGKTIPPWPQLDDGEQQIAVDLAKGVISALRRDMTAQTAALYLHSARYAFGNAEGWMKISDEERQVAIELMDLMVNWLLLEKSVPKG